MTPFKANTVLDEPPAETITEPQRAHNSSSTIQSVISQEQMHAKAEIQGELITRTTLLTVIGVLCGLYVPAFLPVVAIGFIFHVISMTVAIMRYKLIFSDFQSTDSPTANNDQFVAPNYHIFRITV